MKWNKKISKVITTFALAAAVVLLPQMDVNAEYVEADGVEYNNEITVDVQYVSNYANGGGNYTYIYLDDQTERITNVKSSSKNLLAKKTMERVRTSTSKEYDFETNTYVAKSSKSEVSSTAISFFVKKKGTYTVTFDVVGADNKVRCTKSIKVKTDASSTGSGSPIKSIQYAGKDLFLHYPYATKKSGKLSVKANKNYKITKMEIGTRGADGTVVYKATKNNKNMKLATKEKYTQKYSSSTYEYDELFPTTWIRVTWQNKKTKEVGTYTTSLCTLNKK